MTKSPSQSALAFFHAAYKAKNHEMQNFDMDHVVAYRAQRNSTQARLGKPIPLNHVANWLPLSPTLNRRRQNTSWEQFFPTLTAAEQISISPDLFIAPNALNSQLLNDLEKFGFVMLVRYGNMINAALQNVGLNDFIEKSEIDRVNFVCDLLEEINISLGLNANISEVRARLSFL